jgi:hypothetical protein
MALRRLEALGSRFAFLPDGRVSIDAPNVPEAVPLLAELRQHRDEVFEALRAREHPCVGCLRECAPENLFCNVACFQCWRAEHARKETA